MTPVEALQAIAARLEAEWSATPVERVVFPGQLSDPAGADPATPWIRVTVRALPPRSTTHGTVGGRLIEQRSLLIAQAFYPISVEDGSIAPLELATAFRDLFHGRSIGADPLHFETATVSYIGHDAGWTQANVTIPFTYHERV